jgi:DNA-binding MarR family transcriptional regulator
MATTSSAPATNDLAVGLRLAITRTARRLRQEAGAGLSPALTAALATVDRHGPMTPSELAAAERVQRPTATRIVARLEEEGLVTRAADPDDGRACLVSISPEGQALIDEIRERKDAYLAARLDQLDPADLTALARAAGVLERLLEEDPRP